MPKANKTTNKVEAKDELKPQKVSKEVTEKTDKKDSPKKVTTKAGKHSAKAQAEAAEKEAKEVKKAQAKKVENPKSETPKIKQKPRVKKYSRNQKAGRELLEKDKLYSLKEAVELLPKISKVKFDPTAEIHIALNIDPRQADQMVRTNTTLPAGTGKSIIVAVIAGEKEAEAAQKAGADHTDAEALIKEISKEKFNFDVLIATPDKMGELGKLAKVLGPKGLMPSPKNGTVTADPAKSVMEFKKGKVELKNDANGIVHVAFGKLSFKNEDLYNNVKTIVKSLSASKPSGVKGVFIRSMFITSSMSPSIKLDLNEAIKESKE